MDGGEIPPKIQIYAESDFPLPMDNNKKGGNSGVQEWLHLQHTTYPQ